MATKYPNTTLTDDWTLLVTSGDEFTLTSPSGTPIAIATMASAESPSAGAGHTLNTTNREAWNRALAGPGYVYARAPGASAIVELTTWTPS
jgi:hypothetical protein